MTVYRFLGSAVTDANGVASIPYTGVGAGEVDVIASTSNPIIESSLVSEIYEVCDCTKYDGGTISNHNNIWAVNTSSAYTIVERTNEYTEMREATQGSNFSNGTTGVTDSCIIEFDYYQVDGGMNSFMQLVASDNNQSYTGGVNLSHFNGQIQNWYHIKIQIKNGVITFTNTTNGTTFNRTMVYPPVRFNFWSSAEITAIRFKDFMIYPI